MRTIEQIEAEIIQATQQKAEIINRIRALENEKRATVQAQFEADKNVRVGDTLTTKDGKTVYYQGFSTEFDCLSFYCAKVMKIPHPAKDRAGDLIIFK